jgi:hypothetical protein
MEHVLRVGDGVVSVDFLFVDDVFLIDSKRCCCSGE